MTDFLAAARAEAQRLQHDYVGTEHLLLALVQSGDPTLSTILTTFAASPEALRERLEKRSPQGKGPAGGDPAELPLRSGARRAIDSARSAAQGAELGAQQLLGALLADGKGVVAASLGDLGVPVAKVREVLGMPASAPAAPPTPTPPAPRRPPEPKPRAERAEPVEPPERVDRPRRGDRRERKERSERRDRPDRPPEKVERRETEQVRDHTGRSGDRPPRIAPVHQPLFTWRRLPLLAVPASIVLAYGFPSIHPLLVFGVASVAILPLAAYLGEATEQLVVRTGPTLGGFLNATFGNAAELIIAIVALEAGLVDLVKASLTGSILGNLLFILGLSLLAGGLSKPIVRFNRTAAGMSAGMMALAVTGLMFPTLFHALHQGQAALLAESHLSVAVSIVLVVTYGCSLLFSLKTHRPILSGEPAPLYSRPWRLPTALGVLALATGGIAIESEILVHAVQRAAEASSWISQTFLGLIIIPLIGNASEHATAVVVARKGKLDLALGIALGSSAQVALLIAPLLVFIGLAMPGSGAGQGMNLVFTPIEVVAMGLATVLASIVTLDGESHWFEGVQLLALYAMVAIAVFFV
ncbi:MAG TPA: calcium/proton exchanger [Gemmatimonadales bacterium]|nr:calcium/proton exchanger [Gemmatimonadales bacterium]